MKNKRAKALLTRKFHEPAFESSIMSAWMNTDKVFGFVSRGFHWSMALIILGLLALGFWMAGLPFSPFKFELYGLHKAFGILILGLGSLRIISRFIQKGPLALPTHHRWERFLSKTIHIVLYSSIIGMPLSGWIMSSAGEFAVSFFGVFDLPSLSDKNEALYELMKAVHEAFSYALIGALGLHILGALKHHILDRDETLRRMSGNLAIGILGLIFLSIPLTFAVSEILETVAEDDTQVTHVQEASAPSIVAENGGMNSSVQAWVVDPATSSINFEFQQYGQNVSSSFAKWSADIAFDPEDLENSRVDVVIDVSSIQTGSADRDEQARGNEWFEASVYTEAHFESESFTALNPNRYEAFGNLSLHGVKLPVSFPFSLEILDADQGQKRANMSANFMLNRLDFGIGQGQWKATDAIGNGVNIRLEIGAISMRE